MSKSEIKIDDNRLCMIVDRYRIRTEGTIVPYTDWKNKYTVLQMERILREEGIIPWYMGYSHFILDDPATKDFYIFKSWPRYFNKSWKMRLVQLKQRFGRFIQNIGNRIAQ